MIRIIYFIIRSFGDVDNNFRSLFIALHGKLKEFLFIQDAELCLRYKIRDGCSFKKVVKGMDKFHANAMFMKDGQINDLEEELEKIKFNYK